SVQKGRAGVAVATACEVVAVRTGLQGLPTRRDMLTGRWVEADVVFPGEAGPVTVVSAYVPTGELETDKQVAKYEFLGAMTARLGQLMSRAQEPGGSQAVVSGDFNVAHHEADIKNWKGNIGHRGFLEEERAYLTTWLEEQGWADVVRDAAGPGPGPYTWWSWRGKAFDNDAGWRIDYQLATPGLAARVSGFEIGRAETYAARWSDHAPVIVTYA
ncbi:MAG: endonuclease/exonuclease/phosphatase family protein, partial [Bifidobacteriaceae bacterium]|nr:endonuclease/exonuclease/phosphatase family protein [Bifidobacteriaceae bacterium]